MKIRIFQPIVPEYRVALFNGVGRRYGADVEVWASDGAGQDKSYPLETLHSDYAHPFKSLGPLRWQKGLSLRGLKKGDVIVVCGDVHQLSSLWIAAKARLCGIGVVWWGHHKTATSRRLGVWIRLAIAKFLSDVFLCYTNTGVKYLERCGFKRGRVFATGNTIDQEPIKKAIAKVLNHSDAQTLLAPYVLCCGVLREKVKLDLFLKAMTDSRLQGVSLVVIGDGPMKSRWQALAGSLGVANRVRWIAGTRDQEVMAPWFLGAKAFVYPGAIGLSILHSFSYALPVITHDNADRQMPEFEVMEDGKTGFCFAEDDIEELTACCNALLSNEEKRLEMSRYCQYVAFNQYSMKQMINNYCSALEVLRGKTND